MPIRRLGSSLALGLLVSAPLAAAPFTVTFVLDMRQEIAAQRFDPAKDVAGVRGGIVPLTWEQSLPARDEDGDGRYSLTVSFPEAPYGGQAVPYKYKVDSPGKPSEGWEEGKNRLLFPSATAQEVARRFNEPPPPIVPAHTGTLRTHPAFPSKFLAPRDVVVYLPPGYEKETSRRYPVLYLHDGQNVFDATEAGMEWQLDEIAERLIRAGQIEPLIIVAIDNVTDARWDEYTPTPIEWKKSDGTIGKGGGKAGLYGRLLLEEVKPFIDRTYRTRPEARHTALGGASLGGLVSLYLGLKHPEALSGIVALSTAVEWDDAVILKTVAALPAKPPTWRIWVGVGTREREAFLTGARQLRDALVAKGLKLGGDLRYLEQENGQHDEISWAAQVEPILRFLYGKR